MELDYAKLKRKKEKREEREVEEAKISWWESPVCYGRSMQPYSQPQQHIAISHSCDGDVWRVVGESKGCEPPKGLNQNLEGGAHGQGQLVLQGCLRCHLKRKPGSEEPLVMGAALCDISISEMSAN